MTYVSEINQGEKGDHHREVFQSFRDNSKSTVQTTYTSSTGTSLNYQSNDDLNQQINDAEDDSRGSMDVFLGKYDRIHEANSRKGAVVDTMNDHNLPPKVIFLNSHPSSLIDTKNIAKASKRKESQVPHEVLTLKIPECSEESENNCAKQR